MRGMVDFLERAERSKAATLSLSPLVDSSPTGRHWRGLLAMFDPPQDGLRVATPGEVAEWLKAADCKSAGLRPTLVRIQPSPPFLLRQKTNKFGLKGGAARRLDI